MKLKALPITDLEDATLDFEQLNVHGIFDDTVLGGDLTGKLPNPTLSTQGRQRFVQLATPAARFESDGTGTLVFTAATSSATLTVTHGLGGAPTRIVFGVQNFGGVCTPSFQNITATTFDVVGWIPGAATVNVVFHWVALR